MGYWVSVTSSSACYVEGDAKRVLPLRAAFLCEAAFALGVVHRVDASSDLQLLRMLWLSPIASMNGQNGAGFCFSGFTFDSGSLPNVPNEVLVVQAVCNVYWPV